MKKLYFRGFAITLAMLLCMTLFSGSGWKQKSGVKNQMAKNVVEILEPQLKDSGIISITFMNKKNAKGTDVSARRDGSVVAWLKDHPGTKAKDLYIAANGKVIAPQDCSGLFEDLTGVQEINFNNCFDTSKVTDMSDMFAYCLSLSELDLSSFNTKNVTNMSGMFLKCMDLESVDVSGFNTSSVTDMSFMFYHCYDLKELNIRNFNTKKVRSMGSMFEACTSLESLDLSSFYTDEDTDIGFMFWRCQNLKYLDISNLDCSNYIDEGKEEMFTVLCSNDIYVGVEIIWPDGMQQEALLNNTIYFGRYEQDEKKSKNTESIEWIVLDVQGDKALLLSVDALDSVPFHKAYASVTWEDCSLRSWLNDTFLNDAFTKEERSFIFTTKVDNSASQGNQKWKTKNNNTTNDKIFLLSYAEVDQYFNDEASRICKPTEYALSRGADIRKQSDGTESGWWWLRAPGQKPSHAAFVNFDGKMYSNAVGNDYLSVRPAMWIDLDAYYASLG